MQVCFTLKQSNIIIIWLQALRADKLKQILHSDSLAKQEITRADKIELSCPLHNQSA